MSKYNNLMSSHI